MADGGKIRVLTFLMWETPSSTFSLTRWSSKDGERCFLCKHNAVFSRLQTLDEKVCYLKK